MSSEDAYAMRLLSYGMQKWVSQQGWNGFRQIQRDAIITLLEGDNPPNLVISAPTASGKTEAALMPALSIADDGIASDGDARIRILYLAPLKALINDQYRRTEDMAQWTSVTSYMWHTDVPARIKNALMREHDGMMLTTPESLESFLMNRGRWCSAYLHPDVIVIDEFHAFLGEGRGKQLMSLISRVTRLCEDAGHHAPTRIALSATLSQLDVVADMLDPDRDTAIIQADDTQDAMDVSVQGIPPLSDEGLSSIDYQRIAEEIVRQSGHDKTLSFCRSRSDVELVTGHINACLDRMRDDGKIGRDDPIAAMPHHGQLSKQTREELEYRLVSTEKPTMAVATQTLELGIDIGDIAKVFQVRNASSVSSLRQRIGRSGRRDGVKRLAVLAPLSDNVTKGMQYDLVTSISEIELMRGGWFEPPEARRTDVSVLVSETLSALKQYGSAYQDELYALLCSEGAFRNVSEDLYDLVICDMLDKSLIDKHASGELLIGERGESLMDDWHFYAVFQDTEGYTVNAGNKAIGTITPSAEALMGLARGMCFQLGGKKWQPLPNGLDMDTHTIHVRPSATGSVLTSVGSDGPSTCGRILRTNIALLTGKASGYVPRYVDDAGLDALREARDYARSVRLNPLGLSLVIPTDTCSDLEVMAIRKRGYVDDAVVHVAPPVDDAALNAIMALVRTVEDREPAYDRRGNRMHASFDCIMLSELVELVEEALADADEYVGNEGTLINNTLLADIRSREKNNMYLSDETLRFAYGAESMDVAGATKWMRALTRFYELPTARRNGGDDTKA